MELNIGTVVGLIAAALSLSSFLMKGMLPLRLLALAANVAFIAYGIIDSIAVALILHAILLPINAKRAWDIRKLIRDIETARADSPVSEWLLPHMTRRTAKAGETLWRSGDKASEMLYVQTGSVRLVEYDETLGPGTLVGEIGLFSPENRRTQSLVCTTDCELYSLSAEGMYKLYYQNPKLGFHLMRLVVGRLIRDAAAARKASTVAAGAADDANPQPVAG
ncbi:MAG: cyclic nucleotide-binding domain-containing protein [Burkholderiales bacterium]|nr:MAG: cyclic nucleotide-binding domain-containing protein [Burkholderiales bacterium]